VVNGRDKYDGHLVATRNKKSFRIEKLAADS